MKANLFRRQAIALRKRGLSLDEIHNRLRVAKSTVSLWVRDVSLSKKAQNRISNLGVNGRLKGAQVRKNVRDKFIAEIVTNHQKELKQLPKSKFLDKLLCAMLYWCEGEKTTVSIAFVNSDPILIKTFLKLLRSAYKLSENKFRALAHLHTYHDEEKQKKYWSKVTGIPLTQFHKVYWKKNSGNSIKDNYQGCISVRYYDHRIVKDLMQLWELFAKMGA